MEAPSGSLAETTPAVDKWTAGQIGSHASRIRDRSVVVLQFPRNVCIRQVAASKVIHIDCRLQPFTGHEDPFREACQRHVWNCRSDGIHFGMT